MGIFFGTQNINNLMGKNQKTAVVCYGVVGFYVADSYGAHF